MSLFHAIFLIVATGALAWALLLHRRLRQIGSRPSSDPAAHSTHVEAALRESETRFRTVVESLGEGLVINDSNGKVLYINRRMTELTGYTLEELAGKSASSLIPEDQRDLVEAKVEDRRAGRAEEYEVEVQRKDGTRFWTVVHGRPHRNAAGRIIGSLSTIADITARRAAQEALRESEERYRALFEDDVAGNFITSVEGRILACNQAFAHIFGFSSIDEAVGAPALPHSVNAAARQDFLNLVREKRRIEYHEVEMRRKDGSPVHVMENVNGIFDDDGELTGLQGHLIDISDRKVLEEQLRQSQKMEAVGRLAGGIAHDFNNLLTAITGYTDLLLMNSGASESIREDLGRIQQATDRAATLTNQLLAFSRRQVLQPKVISMNGVVENVSNMLERLIGEDIALDTRLDPRLWRVQADPNQLEQVLMNLVVNARDAMPNGGALTLTTRNLALSEATAARNLELERGSYTVLEVSDTGEGISAELQGRIFEPFFTTKAAGKGTGLGLSMAYGLMKQSGGHIAVESAPGEGSTFRIYLPRVSEAAPDESAPSDRDGDPAPAPVTAGVGDTASVQMAEPVEIADKNDDDRTVQGAETGPGSAQESPAQAVHSAGTGGPAGLETILLVEDDSMLRGLARRVLSRKGYTIIECAGATAAMERGRDWPGSIHLLLADTRMAEADEASATPLAERLIALRPALKVLFMSDPAERRVHRGKAADRATPTIAKPFTPVELARKVREALDRKRAVQGVP